MADNKPMNKKVPADGPANNVAEYNAVENGEQLTGTPEATSTEPEAQHAAETPPDELAADNGFEPEHVNEADLLLENGPIQKILAELIELDEKRIELVNEIKALGCKPQLVNYGLGLLRVNPEENLIGAMEEMVYLLNLLSKKPLFLSQAAGAEETTTLVATGPRANAQTSSQAGSTPTEREPPPDLRAKARRRQMLHIGGQVALGLSFTLLLLYLLI